MCSCIQKDPRESENRKSEPKSRWAGLLDRGPSPFKDDLLHVHQSDICGKKGRRKEIFVLVFVLVLDDDWMDEWIDRQVDR